MQTKHTGRGRSLHPTSMAWGGKFKMHNMYSASGILQQLCDILLLRIGILSLLAH